MVEILRSLPWSCVSPFAINTSLSGHTIIKTNSPTFNTLGLDNCHAEVRWAHLARSLNGARSHIDRSMSYWRGKLLRYSTAPGQAVQSGVLSRYPSQKSEDGGFKYYKSYINPRRNVHQSPPLRYYATDSAQVECNVDCSAPIQQ